MRRAIAGRLVFALALVVLAFVGAFVLTALAPGDAVDAGLRSTQSVDAERARLGLDKPVLTRLATRVARLAVLDFGRSIRYDQPVLTLVLQRTITTMQTGAVALGLALVIGIPAGVASSRARRTAVRRVIAALSIALLSIPALVVALVLAVVASSVGLTSWMVMTIALALPAAALIERLQSRAMDAVQGETCLRAARARGVREVAVTWRHAWPLSLSAVLGVTGIIAGHLLSGALAIELVTARSGLGLLTYEALMARDVELAAGCAAAAALIVGLATLAADVVQLWVDPRSVA